MKRVTDKQTRLDQIAGRMVADRVCPELAQASTQIVPGDGNPDASILLIGEAPGAKEDEQGVPFVGASGKLLGEMLESIGMARSDTYITNIVKYRPPDNRDPLPEEIAASMPYLMEQIAVIEPELIVFLGRHAMNVFFPDLKISQVHGRPKRLSGQVYLPLYHPAAALYNGSMRMTLAEDFAKIPAILELIRSSKTVK
jgi:uracil-DNA glycosylase